MKELRHKEKQKQERLEKEELIAKKYGGKTLSKEVSSKLKVH